MVYIYRVFLFANNTETDNSPTLPIDFDSISLLKYIHTGSWICFN